MRSEPYLKRRFSGDGKTEDQSPSGSQTLRVHASSTAGRRDATPLPRIPLPGERFANANNSEIIDPNADNSPMSLVEISREYDIRSITPRKMIDLSFDLFFSGFLNKEQYADLAFQSELMPNFDQTIGALTGQRAQPDRPRDFTEIWLARLEFEKQHADDPRIIERTGKILDLLKSIKRTGKPKKASASISTRKTITQKKSDPIKAAGLPPLGLNAKK